MNPVQKANLKIHIAVILFGFTAILGGLIQLNALVLVWWRMGITVVSLLFLMDLKRIRTHVKGRTWWILLLNGGIIALHWLCFYGSIKLANASVALVCLASASFFAAIAEPLLLRQRINRIEIGLGILIIPAMALIVRELDFSMMTGVWVGIAAALFSAIFAAVNKLLVTRAHSYDITFIELGSGWLMLSFILPVAMQYQQTVFWPSPSDWVYLVILAILCTTLAFILSLQSLTHLSAFNSTLIVNLEPIYGIALAWVILKENEQLTTNFYLGVLLILAIVFLFPLLKKRFGR
jgi:drug/metabolite transporter (DMT)-like permease